MDISSIIAGAAIVAGTPVTAIGLRNIARARRMPREPGSDRPTMESAGLYARSGAWAGMGGFGILVGAWHFVEPLIAPLVPH